MSPAAFLRGLLLDLLFLPVLLLALPWIAFLIVVRRRGVGALAERLGDWRISRPQRDRIWVHCVSVGELQAAEPLLTALARVRPGAEFVLSVTTTTAREIARERYPDIPVYFYPVDVSWFVRRVLGRVRPSAIVLVELEVWPQLVLEATGRGIPVVVANGRISTRGFRRLSKLAFLARPVFRRLTEVHAREPESAERFRDLGVPRERIHDLGNLKLDRAPLADRDGVRNRFERRFGYAPRSLRFVAGCTHPGEEERVLVTFAALRLRWPDLSLLLAPRHIERSDAVAALVRERGFTLERWSAPRDTTPDVVILDRVGRLAELYAVGDVAFVGGSLIERGGHNILEPILAGVATVHGPHMANFREQVEMLTEGGASARVEASTLTEVVGLWLGAPRRRAERVARGLAAIERSRGAAARSAARIAGLLGGGGGGENPRPRSLGGPAPVESAPVRR